MVILNEDISQNDLIWVNKVSDDHIVADSVSSICDVRLKIGFWRNNEAVRVCESYDHVSVVCHDALAGLPWNLAHSKAISCVDALLLFMVIKHVLDVIVEELSWKLDERRKCIYFSIGQVIAIDWVAMVFAHINISDFCTPLDLIMHIVINIPFGLVCAWIWKHILLVVATKDNLRGSTIHACHSEGNLEIIYLADSLQLLQI